MNQILKQLIENIATETGSCQDDLVNAINQEKLNAAKWGMEQAVMVVTGTQTLHMDRTEITSTLGLNVRAFANTLTIDQLPK